MTHHSFCPTRRCGMTRRQVLTLATSGLLVLGGAVAGCGGGGGGDNTGPSNLSGPGTKPTDTTRAKVSELHQMSLRNLSTAGFSTAAMGANFGHNGTGGGATGVGSGAPMPLASSVPGTAEDASGGAGVGIDTPPAMTNIGAFLRNIASVPPTTRATRTASSVSRSRNQDTSVMPPAISPYPPDKPYEPYIPPPTFYFDYYLNLWVQTDSTASSTTYTLFEDEAKTKAAGSIVTKQPANWEEFPQVYESSYEFTAGTSAGSKGYSKNITNREAIGSTPPFTGYPYSSYYPQYAYSSSSEYSNEYADGWKDSGKSSSDARGNSTWTSRTETASGKWVQSNGSFRGDGSGGTRTETSEGYKADYTYQASGAGRGVITGPDPGLPVTISWDRYGNTTTEYADGTVERTPGYHGYYYGGPYHGGGYGYGGVGGGGYPMPVAGDGGIGSTEPAKP